MLMSVLSISTFALITVPTTLAHTCAAVRQAID